MPRIARLVVVAEVVVAVSAVRPPANVVEAAVQILLFARFKDATTFPAVGLITRVPSVFVTEVTVPPPAPEIAPQTTFPAASVVSAFVLLQF